MVENPRRAPRFASRRLNFAFFAATLLAFAPLTMPAGAAPTTGAPEASLARLPLRFEQNIGQTDARVRFLARGAGYGIFLTADETVLAFDSADRVVRMRFVGANPSPASTGERELPGRSAYLTGADSSTWRDGVRAFGAVRYDDVYPGVDAVFYGNEGSLEYDFVVAPQADASAIRMDLDGADDVALDASGDVVLRIGGRDVKLRAPVAYQTVAGGRLPVACAYRADGDAIRLVVGSYDRSLPLVIDPVLNYSTYLGGAGVDRVASIAVDSLGNAYVAGSTTSADFPTQSPLPIPSRSRDAFVAKIDRTGTSLVFSTYIGGSGDDAATALAIDSSGNLYVAGTTSSVDFPVAGSAFTRRGAGTDIFVAKVAANGQSLVSSSAFGGGGDDDVAAIAVDSSGNIAVTGATNSSDFPTQLPFQISSGGGDRDAFVTKLNPTSTALVYSSYLGGSARDEGNGIAFDSTGNVVLAGFTTSTNFPTRRALQPANAGNRDVFVASVTVSGTELIYSTYLGGENNDFATALALGSDGALYLTGQTFSNNFPVEGTLAPNAGNGDVFIAKLNADVSDIVYATFVGGANEDQGNAIAVDASGAAYVTGFTSSTDFPTRLPLQTETGDANMDAFVLKINPTGSQLGYSTYFGGNGSDRGLGIATDGSGNAYIAGITGSTNLPTQSPIQTDRAEEDGFVAKIGNSFVDLSVALAATPEPVRSEGNLTYTITVTNPGPDVAGNVVVTFDTPPGTTFVSANVPNGSCTTPEVGGTGEVSCLVGSIAAGATATATVVVNVTAAQGATITGTASISSTVTDTNPANDTASTTSTVIAPVDPPVITSVVKIVDDTFRVRINGSNFQPGVQVFIGDDATPWPSIKVKGTTRITLKGSTLKSRFPKNIPVNIRVVNPDGGEATSMFTRKL